MRLATFNILHGMTVRGDHPGEVDPIALAEAVAGLRSDVLGMQEVDVHQPRSANAHQVRDAAGAMGAEHWRFIPTVVGTPGPGAQFRPVTGSDVRTALMRQTDTPLYGIGLISRWPVVRWHQMILRPSRMWLPLLIAGGPHSSLQRVPDEPRAAIAAVLQVGDALMTVATVHLSFVPGVNVSQLRRVRRWLDPLPRPLVLLGDFNLPGRIPRLVTGWQEALQAATYPVFSPGVQFDHVLSDGLTATGAAAHQLGVSDHCAVTADFPSPTG